MKVKELIEKLKVMPEDAELLYVWDGLPRSSVDYLWLSIDGDVILCDQYQSVRPTGARPEGSPSEKYDLYWGPIGNLD